MTEDPDWTYDQVSGWLYGPDPNDPQLRRPVATVPNAEIGAALAAAMNREAPRGTT